jgi:hypothetical protein
MDLSVTEIQRRDQEREMLEELKESGRLSYKIRNRL